MPPPRLPELAAALASIVGQTVIEITSRQETLPSTSDAIRGVHKAMQLNLTVIGPDFPKQVTDAAHGASSHFENGHRDGFCRACAAIYVAVNEAMTEARKVHDA